MSGQPPPWRYDDGGRSGYFDGDAGDCVPRAIAIADRRDYREVYDALAAGTACWFDTTAGRRRATTRSGRRRNASPRSGTFPQVYRPYLENVLGWVWTPTMHIGSGCTTHLDADWCEAIVQEHGPVIVRLSKHLTVVDYHGIVHDTHDPSREGTRCVYGFWRRGWVAS